MRTSNSPFLRLLLKGKPYFDLHTVLHAITCSLILRVHILLACNDRVEATQDALSIREGRAADPQYLVLSPFGFQPQIQAGFHGSPFNYYPYGALPYKYVKPVEGQQRAFGTTISSVFNALVPSNLKGTSTSTIFSTFFTVVTSKSTATCSPPPNVLRCDSR